MLLLCKPTQEPAVQKPSIFMIKGCQRRIIMVNQTNSAYFDSAYFVLRSDLPPSAHDSDMLAEAHRMIDSYSPDKTNSSSKKKKKPGAWTVVLIALLCLAMAALIVTGIIILF